MPCLACFVSTSVRTQDRQAFDYVQCFVLFCLPLGVRERGLTTAEGAPPAAPAPHSEDEEEELDK